MKQEQNLMEYNPGTLAFKMEELILQGWRLDPDRPMALYGFMWEVWLLRDATDEQIATDEAEQAKPSRAEILAKARAAKAEKKAAEGAASE